VSGSLNTTCTPFALFRQRVYASYEKDARQPAAGWEALSFTQFDNRLHEVLGEVLLVQAIEVELVFAVDDQ